MPVRFPVSWPASLVCAGLLFAPCLTWAGTFQPDGRFALDGAFATSLDSPSAIPPNLLFTLYDSGGNSLASNALAGQFVADPAGLEGAGALRMGGNVPWMSLVVDPLDATFAGRRVELRVWQQPCGTRSAITLYWYGGDLFLDPHYLGSVTFQPTGRVTSDGWEEWTSGPVDWSAGGVYGPYQLFATDTQVLSYQSGAFLNFSFTACTKLDAFEVFDLGPAAVPPASCTAANETAVCASEGVCLYGRCVDAAIVHGAAPQNPQLRSDYLARRTFEMKSFEGGRVPQGAMPGFEQALASLVSGPPTAAFWPTIADAVESLADGHASSPVASYPSQMYTGVCLHHGDPDLTGGGGPMVYSTLSNPVGAELVPGDALLAVDGMPVASWMAVADRLLYYPGDPAAAAVVLAPQIMTAAATAGSTLTFARCVNPPASGPCAPADVITLDVDLGDLLGAPFWAGTAPAWRNDYVECDFRFQRDLNDPQVTNYYFAGFADVAGSRTLLINGVPGLDTAEGVAWANTVYQALIPAPASLILDQRQGGGGSVYAADLLSALLVAPNDFDAMLLAPWTELTFTPGLEAVMRACSVQDATNGFCGQVFNWVLGVESQVGSDHGVAAGTRLAVLNSNDVSGNDFTSMLLSYRSGDTRIFGPGPTWGAFGVIWRLAPHLDEIVGGSVQVHDTVFYDGAGIASGFTTAYGVVPDEVVLQSQRDLIAGIDTQLAAARTWVQGGVP